MLESLGAAEHGFTWADLQLLAPPPRTLTARIHAAMVMYRPDVLFIHRDAERESYETRADEIARASREPVSGHHVPVVPVRMTEAWLLHDEVAIRSAAGNPNGKQPLALPRIRDLETLPDPKESLRDILMAALPDRPRARLQVRQRFGEMRMRVAELTNYEPLKDVFAFRALQNHLERVLVQMAESPLSTTVLERPPRRRRGSRPR